MCEPAPLNVVRGKAELGVRVQASARKSPNKSNCKNLSPKEALNSEISRCQAKENIKLKPPTFAVCGITACSQEAGGGGRFLGFTNGADMEGGK